MVSGSTGRELDRFELVNEQIKAVEAERDAQCAEVDGTAPQAILKTIKGIGAEVANVLTCEGRGSASSEAAYDDDPTGMALAALSASLSLGALVP